MLKFILNRLLLHLSIAIFDCFMNGFMFILYKNIREI